VAGHIKMDKLILKELSSIYRFRVSLDQSFLQTLEDQSQWILQQGSTPDAKAPNFFNSIHLEALEAIKPEAITVIR